MEMSGHGLKACKFTLNIEKRISFEIEQITIKCKPLFHVALENIMGQMIEIVKPNSLRMRIADPVKFIVINTLLAVLIKEIDERSADSDNRRCIHDLACAVIGCCSIFHGMIKGVLGINDAPAHRRCTRAMLLNELCRL